MPSTRYLAISGLVASVLAQTTSVTRLFLLGLEDNAALVASVMSAGPEANVYAINCAPGTDSNDCGVPGDVTWTVGPSTLEWHSTASDVSLDLACALASNTASCIQTIAGDAYYPGTFSNVVSDVSDSLTPLTITAGLELLSGVSATATGSTTTPGSSTAATTGASASGTTATETAASGTASGTSATVTAVSSAAATGAAQHVVLDFAVVGMAGFVGMVMAL